MYRLPLESQAIPPPEWQQLCTCTGHLSSTFSLLGSSLFVVRSSVKRETRRSAIRVSRLSPECGV
ncbi:hypothetical protein SALBM311S_04301 [Streptomyces alboniger]